jgi:hypothetical protein
MPSRAVLIAALTVCAAAQVEAQPSPNPARPPAVKPVRVTPEQFAQLRWLEGTWRGHGVNQSSFYERYRVADDSTMLMESFEDSTLARVTSASRVELRAGQLANVGDGARWVATQVDAGRVTFAPVEGARNTFIWRRASADAWTATLSWPGQPQGQRERVYHMARLR